MTKADDQRIAALAKKNAAKVAKQKEKTRHQYDDTLRIKGEEDDEAQRLFREMKKRES